MMISKGGILAAALVAAVGSPALAVDRSDMTDYVRVSRAAVSPASPAEARRSLDRLGSAAMEACGASFFSVPDQKRAVRSSACWHDSMSNVVARIDNQYLTAAYQRRGTVELAGYQGGSTTHAR